jgi:uncharacterized protein (TIGR02302 family)
MPEQLRWAIARARAVLFWEQLWPALLWPLFIAGLFVLVSLAGLWPLMPVWLHGLVLVAFAGVFVWSLAGVRRLRWPGRRAAIRRLEVASGYRHRPLGSLDDHLSHGGEDPATARLWAAHRQVLAARLGAPRSGWPHPRLQTRDPWALRAALVLLLVAGFFRSDDPLTQRLATGFRFEQVAIPPLVLDAWVTPPAYTRLAPVFLKLTDDSGTGPKRIKAPMGSRLVLRLNGANGPRLHIRSGGKTEKIRLTRKGAKAWEYRAVLDTPSELRLLAREKTAGYWRFDMMADKRPHIAFVRRPDATDSQVLRFMFQAGDDYGITAARAELSLATAPAAGDSEEPGQLFAPPEINLPLSPGQRQSGKITVYRDLTAHPWAGLEVKLTLVARDAAGQEGRSKTARFILPERVFHKPLARAIAEQRRILVREPAGRWPVSRALAALTVAPERFIRDTTVYLGLRTAYRRLNRIDSREALEPLLALLWDIALRVEDGDLSMAQRRFRRLQRDLREALERGASDAQINRLVANLKQALRRYLKALAEKAAQMPPDSHSRQSANRRIVRSRDLVRMLERINRLSRAGARDAARQMLAELQQMLQNLQLNRSSKADRESRGLDRWMGDMDKLIKDQQRLQEDTFRQRKTTEENPLAPYDRMRLSDRPRETGRSGKDDRKGAKEQGQKKPGQSGQRALLRRQQALRRGLQRLTRDLGRLGVPPPSSMSQAGKAMKRSGQSLAKGENGPAAGAQGQALDQLSRSLRAVGKAMNRRLGRGGKPSGKAMRKDPLGRSARTGRAGPGDGVKVPDKAAIERAYEIRKELERRLNDRARPATERDYLERLLRRF